MRKLLLAGSVAILSSLLGPSSAARAQGLEAGALILVGCEGEGCGCTHSKTTNKPFDLYESLSSQSKKIASFKRHVAAKAGNAFAVVKEPGRYRVTSVKNNESRLKTGDLLTLMFYEGEGVRTALRGRDKVSFEEGDIEYATERKTELEQWYHITAGSAQGYSRTFPFEGCLK